MPAAEIAEQADGLPTVRIYVRIANEIAQPAAASSNPAAGQN
jgi:hypothetical protein